MTYKELEKGLERGARLIGHEEETILSMVSYIARTPEGKASLNRIKFALLWQELTSDLNPSLWQLRGRRRVARRSTP